MSGGELVPQQDLETMNGLRYMPRIVAQEMTSGLLFAFRGRRRQMIINAGVDMLLEAEKIAAHAEENPISTLPTDPDMLSNEMMIRRQ